MSQAITTRQITTTINPTVFTHTRTHTNVFTRFMAWCEEQEKNRFLWLGLTFFGLIGLAVPCTLFAILMFGGNNFNLWILACVINSPVLAISLAAQPTKVTLPALIFAWSADLLIILGCVAAYLLS